ncbi:alpha/beta fold hydrolase [Pyruvatibacter mobilis]|uniref:alpha/beta fold hydrolase n=1 Tax=Pyruvatibacter mobilis TaxID=1712261 RepID=UPI003D0C1172
MVDFSPLTGCLDHDPTIAWRMQFGTLTIRLVVEVQPAQILTIGPAAISLAEANDAHADQAADITLTADPDTWAAYARADAPVGYQSLASMIETGKLRVDAGDIMSFARHTMMLEKLFSALRPRKAVTAKAHGRVEIEPVTGRYIRMDLEGRPHRIYFEEAGEGIPLICLHTAGSDGRQYRALMNDPEITSRFRVIAFDLPWHGKSSPPPGFHLEPYALTTDRYVATIMAVKEALGLDQPVVMGCSIGGRAVLHLALRHGAAFRAAIGLQSATHAESHMQHLLGMEESYVLYRPDVHGGEVAAASVMQLMSPTSPVEDEWETLWYYMQGGPGVFQGDLFYYFADGDMRNGIADAIDTSKCPLYLLSGEYDLSATPEMGRALAEAVNATHFEVMKGLGHFPMSEDPARFRTYLLPVLKMIEDAA